MERELAFRNQKNGVKVAQMLLEENYVVMLSKEENLLVLNYVWEPEGNRGFVTFGDTASLVKECEVEC